MRLVIWFIMLTFLPGCKKENVNGTVLIRVLHKNTPVKEPGLYLKRGTLVNPGIQFDEYDRAVWGNEKGIVVVEDLTPDDYFFLGRAESSAQTIEGGIGINVRKTSNINRYEVILELN